MEYKVIVIKHNSYVSRRWTYKFGDQYWLHNQHNHYALEISGWKCGEYYLNGHPCGELEYDLILKHKDKTNWVV